MNARKRIAATLAMLAAATLSLTTTGTANAHTVEAEASVGISVGDSAIFPRGLVGRVVI